MGYYISTGYESPPKARAYLEGERFVLVFDSDCEAREACEKHYLASLTDTPTRWDLSGVNSPQADIKPKE